MARTPLQNHFNRQVRDALSFERLLAERLAQRLVSQGVVLSTAKKRRLERAIAARDPKALTFKVPATGESITLALTETDSNWLSDRLRAARVKLPSLIDTTAHALSNRNMRNLLRGWPDEAKRRKKALRGFEVRFRKVWSKPLDHLELLISIAEETGSNANASLRRRRLRKSPALVDVLTRLHARACQVAQEIATLLRSGFADGAIARWRTLHELAVTFECIRLGGEQLATRYLLHHAVEAKRAADQYMEWCGKRGERKLAKRVLRRIEKDYAEAIKRYGRAFGSEYGWAADLLKNSKPKFFDIEKYANVDFWRPDYKMASYNVHANAKGILFRLGLTSDEVLLTGKSNTGLGDPGRNTSASLTPMTCNLILMVPSLDSIVAARIMLKLSFKTEQLFVETERRLQH